MPLVPKPMVYTLMPYSTANSLAIFGSIKPALLTPSVSKIITLLLALLSLSLFTDVASPMPMAVPPSMMVLYFISSNDRNTIALSLVMGVFVYLSPAYSTIPIRSFGRPFINSEATSFKASSLFGDKSFASILADTSIAITISIPLVVFVLVVTSTDCGRAMATMSTANASKRNTNKERLN